MSNPTSLALRDNKGKPELSQVDPLLMEEVARVLEFGARKYARNNWRKGQPVTRLLDSAMRHMAAILRGEDVDPESGCKHWAHVCCNMMFLGCQEGRADLDDRYKTGEKKRQENARSILEQMRKEFPEKEAEEAKLEPRVFVCDAATMDWKYGDLKKKPDEVLKAITRPREQVGGGGGKVVDKKEGNPWTGRNLPKGWEEAQEKSRMARDEIMANVFRKMSEEEVGGEGVGCDWISKDEEERREAIRLAIKAWDEEEEEIGGEEESDSYDDLDSQNPPSPPGTPPCTKEEIEEVDGGGDVEKDPRGNVELRGGNTTSVKDMTELEKAQHYDKFYETFYNIPPFRFKQLLKKEEEKNTQHVSLEYQNSTSPPGTQHVASSVPYDDMFPEQVTYETDDE